MDEDDDLMRIFPASRGVVYDGLVKLKLVHSCGFSLMLPDLVLADLNGWKWYQPQFFTACQMSFRDEQAYAQLAIDVDSGPQLLLGFTKDRLVRRFDDGSQLYRCKIDGPPDLDLMSSGTCSISAEGEIFLDLFHHTLPETIDLIQSSGFFRASEWNIQGSRTLANVGYAYFTCLPTIQCDDDLRRIAMAPDEEILLCPTNARSPADIVSIKVYRQCTSERRAVIEISVASDQIASQHVYRHAPAGAPVYYECCHPAISRVGLLPGCVAPFDNGRLSPMLNELKRFDYVVLGDADTPDGLEAPYDEEETKALFFIERCEDSTFFDFWRDHGNLDLVAGRRVEMMLFK